MTDKRHQVTDKIKCCCCCRRRRRCWCKWYFISDVVWCVWIRSWTTIT